MELLLQGFFLQASLILALGAQNIYVLESGLRKRRHLLVAALCTVCDAALILLGVLGAAFVLVQIPWLKVLFGALGVAFLGYYGLRKLFENSRLDEGSSNAAALSIGVVVAQTLAFSLLNPHVYLDTIVLIGGYATQFSASSDRLLFGLGASLFSMVWFFVLAFFAAAMGKFLHNAKAMRAISIVSGLILIILAIKLGVDVWEWASTLLRDSALTSSIS